MSDKARAKSVHEMREDAKNEALSKLEKRVKRAFTEAQKKVLRKAMNHSIDDLPRGASPRRGNDEGGQQ